MVVKVYISGMSGNKEVKKRQQRVLMILDSKHIKYDVIDITEPGKEADKDFMQTNSKSNGGTVSDPNPRSPLPPQLFNDDEYCGDYDQFDLANEVDTLEQFLKLEPPSEALPEESVVTTTDMNGTVHKDSKENSVERVNENETSEVVQNGTKTESESGEGSKEPSPSKDEVAAQQSGDKEPSPVKEKSVEKDQSPAPEKEKSVEKDQSPAPESVELKESSKENSPDNVEENGKISSREQSQEKAAGDAIVTKTVNASEDLITSEKAAAAE